jgi:hypothetical protein
VSDWEGKLPTDENKPVYVQTPSCCIDLPKDGRAQLRVITVADDRAKVGEVTEVSKESYTDVAMGSPGNVHMYDSLGRHVGVDGAGNVEYGIPNSFYFSHYTVETEDGEQVFPERIIIFDPCDKYVYEVVGTEQRTYDLSIKQVKDGNEIIVEGNDIPTSLGAVHDYIVDWEVLSRGEEGVTLHIDADGDGQSEMTITSDAELTADDLTLGRSDLDNNGFVDSNDLKILSGHWLSANCIYPAPCTKVDLNYDSRIDAIDLSVFARVWQRGISPGKARYPSPADQASDVDCNSVLGWQRGDRTVNHEVYLGTDFNDVNDANMSSEVYMGSFAGNSWDPCGLTCGTAYYWRVDSGNRFTTTKGKVWSFTAVCGPVAHWKFDEIEGAIAQDSAGVHDANVNGAAWTSGKVNNALSFDGIDDYVDCGNSDLLSPEVFTLAFWMLSEGYLSNRYIILGKAADLEYSREYTVTIENSGKLAFYFGEDINNRVEVSSRFAIPTGQWLHVVLIRDGSKASIYLNGRLDTSASYSFQPTNMGCNLRIGSVGSSGGQGRYFKGKIDDLRIYDRPLTEEEIERLSVDSIDAYRLENFETGSLERFPWITYSDSASSGEWAVTSDKAHSGFCSGTAGTINDDESTTLEVEIDCLEGNISFWRKVSSEINYDVLEFYVDHIKQGTWSGDLDWQKVSFPVAKGTRTFTWTYRKDGSSAYGDDSAWIDDIMFP